MVNVRLDLRGALNEVRPRLFDGVVARTHPPGDALEYTSGPEHRDLEELQHLVDQLAGLPVVAAAEPDSKHPLGHPDNLIIAGAEYYEIGRVISGKVDGDKAVASIYIHDAGALQEIEDGTRELSLGYRCSLDSARYQREITLDHLSVVPRARCGAECSLRVDALPVEPKCGCPLAKSVADATKQAVNVSDLTVGVKVVLDPASEKLLNDLKALGHKDEVTVTVEVEEEDDCAECPQCGADLPEDSTYCPGCGEALANMAMDAKKCDACKKLMDNNKCDACKAKTAKSDKTEPCSCNTHAKMLNTGEQTMDAAELQKKLDEALAEITALKAAVAKADEDSTLALNQANADLKAEKLVSDKLAADIEAVKADAAVKIDAATKTRTDADEADFQVRVDARVELLDAAGKVGIENFKTMTDRAIKVAIVSKVDEMDVEDNRSADYVNAMYTGAMKRFGKAVTSLSEVRETVRENTDAASVAGVDPYKDELAIREAAEAKRANRWRS